MIEKEKYTLFARDATGDIRHAAEVHGQTEKLTCISCLTDLTITCIQCQDSYAFFPVFEHVSGVLCLKDNGLGVLLYSNQLLHKNGQIKQPEYSETLESVLTMVPGFPNRFYELPAQIQTYPSSIIHFDKVTDIPPPDNQTFTCLITTPSQVYGLAMSVNSETGFIISFDIDETGRLPVMIINLESSIESLLTFSTSQLDKYILNTSSREWLIHPVYLENNVRLTQSRYKLSLERAEQQSETLQKLTSTEIINMEDTLHTTETAFCLQHHESLSGLMRYAEVALSIDLINDHNRIISQSGIQSLSHYEKVAQSFPSGLPWHFDIIILFQKST